MAIRIILIFWAVFVSYWLVSALGVKKTKQRGVLRSNDIVRLILLVALALLWRIPATHTTTLGQRTQPLALESQWLGAVLCGVGIAFAIWARRHLGRNWGMPMSVKANPELITSGPYQLVRHPIYTGVLLAMLGSVLVLGAAWVLLFIFYFVYFLYSAKQEEKVMAQEFPQEYPDYKQRTKLLIPYIL